MPAKGEPGTFRNRPVSHLDLNEEEIAPLRVAHEEFRGKLDGAELSEGDVVDTLYHGRGIVTVAGGEYFGPAIVGLKMLRQTGCALPVEAFLADWEEYEEEICEVVLPALNARCVVLEDFISPEDGEMNPPVDLKVGHYQLKSFALLFSTFEHVLYLDSDSILLIDPVLELFNKEPYLSTGFVGWPDFWIGTEAPEFYSIVGLPSFPSNTLPETSSESGQILVDKRRHLKTLLLAAYYNVWGPQWYYPLLSQGALGQGDKNTFETAAFVLDLPWYRVKTPVKAIGRMDNGQFRGSAMVQFHPGNDMDKYGNTTTATNISPTSFSDKRQVAEPLGTVPKDVRAAFVHANTPKMNSGHLVDEGDLKDAASGQALRLWGSVEEQLQLFGEDLEKKVWMVVVDVGCELAATLREWKARKGVCERLKGHWDDVFE